MLSVVMNNREKVFLFLDVLDEDGQRVETKPSGLSVSVVSSDPNIVKVTDDGSGLGFKFNSKKVGTASVSISVSGGGLESYSDTVAFAVVNSAPKSIGARLGTPVPEDESDEDAMPEE